MNHLPTLLCLGITLISSPGWTQDTLRLPSRRVLDRPQQVLTPNVSSSLVLKGNLEVNLTQVLLTQDLEIIDVNFVGVADTSYLKASQFFHTLQLNYGVWPRLNVGFDIQYGHARSDEDLNRSAWAVLGAADDNSVGVRGLGAMGPRVRWTPFQEVPELSFQSAALFPATADTLTRQALGRDRVQWQNQLIFYQRIARMYLFLQADATILLENEERRTNTFSFPLNAYLIVPLWRTRSVVFPQVHGIVSASYVPSYERNPLFDTYERRSLDSRFTLGLSARMTPSLDLTLIYLVPIVQDFNGGFSTVVPGTDYGIGLTLRYVYRTD